MNRKIIFVTLFITLLANAAQTVAQTTSFTHQGILAVPNNAYEFEFKLFDTPTVGTGTQQGATIQKLFPNTVQVTNNAFTVQLDFGAAVFTGGELYLETGWRVVGGGAFTVLAPRERITAVYANRSLSAVTADTATNATQLGGLPASGFIQNTTGQQAATNFNIGGNGTAGGTLSGNTVNAATQYNLNGTRIIGAIAPHSLFVGANSGNSITSGFNNTFFGAQAGSNNSSGQDNAFFGLQAGYLTSTGNWNSFFGSQAGLYNNTGTGNSFFGAKAGAFNTTGNDNAFFGYLAGNSNKTGTDNLFSGSYSGFANTSGSYNTFVGRSAGGANIVGDYNAFLGYGAGSNNFGRSNTFIGANAGNLNQGGNENIFIGYRANGSSSNLTNAIAIGANSQVNQNNSLILGSISGVNSAAADTLVGIGTTTPAAKLHISGAGVVRARVNSDSNAGLALSLNNQSRWSVATVTGGQFQIYNDAIGSNAVWIDASTNNVGIGTTTPGADKLVVNGFLRVNVLGAGASTNLCINPSFQISICSSSIRYKTNIATLYTGLGLINRLRPVTFDWKQNHEHDLGLVAEEVAKVEPLLVTRSANGEIEGVKYDRVAVVLINAVKEQQQLIEQQQRQIDALKRLVCSSHRKAKVCK